jgi:hypothetical protein
LSWLIEWPENAFRMVDFGSPSVRDSDRDAHSRARSQRVNDDRGRQIEYRGEQL